MCFGSVRKNKKLLLENLENVGDRFFFSVGFRLGRSIRGRGFAAACLASLDVRHWRGSLYSGLASFSCAASRTRALHIHLYTFHVYYSSSALLLQHFVQELFGKIASQEQGMNQLSKALLFCFLSLFARVCCHTYVCNIPRIRLQLACCYKCL